MSVPQPNPDGCCGCKECPPGAPPPLTLTVEAQVSTDLGVEHCSFELAHASPPMRWLGEGCDLCGADVSLGVTLICWGGEQGWELVLAVSNSACQPTINQLHVVNCDPVFVEFSFTTSGDPLCCVLSGYGTITE